MDEKTDPNGREHRQADREEEPSTAASFRYASFWRRLGASFVDGLLVAAAYLLFVFLVFQLPGSGGFSIEGPAVPLLLFVPPWLYYALMESSDGQATLGKMVFGIKVTTIDGTPISFLRATGRYFAKNLSGLFFGAGYLMAAFTDRKQALHDMIAGTLVVRGR